MSDTIAAIATGMQISAIGILRLSGPETINVADRVFRPFSGKSIREYESRKLVYGGLYTNRGELIDICLCTISRAPNTYTGEDTAEFQCHGSPMVLRTALDEMFAIGARQAGPGEFTKRAFLNGRMDLSSAEAVADIIDAETFECVKNAAGQLSGAIAVKIDGIYDALKDISAHFHAVLDYPDEDIEDFRIQEYVSVINNCRAKLAGLMSTFADGKLMKSGIPAVLAGRPNAGKSSLMNSLLGYERAIVTDIPGTTRDTIEEKVKIGGVCLRLTDTAGLHETEDYVESLGVGRTKAAVENAELVIAVIDGNAEFSDEDAEIVAMAEKAPHGIIVITKKDLRDDGPVIDSRLSCVQVSNLTGEGMDALANCIRNEFPLPDVPAGEILTNARQADAVRRGMEYIDSALDALNSGMTPDIILTETEGAMQALGELTGKTVHEDITNRIFQRFCVGK